MQLSELYGKDGTMVYQATRYYDKAIQKVLARIESKASGFATTFASILTLVLVQVYSGNSSKWRQHLQGANTLLQTAGSDMDGIESVKTSVQSMHIIHIIGQTSQYFPIHSHKTLLGLGTVADTPDFGFTIGASKKVLQCISQITDLSYEIAGGEPIDHIMPDLKSITGFLDDYHASQSIPDGRTEKTPQHYQTLAFVSAAKIYLHRVIFNAPPKSVQSLVSSMLEQVMKFRRVDSQNNFSIWPAFIAAVEAYTEQDMKDAEKWLDWSSTFGMGNRTSIASVVREAWQRREEKSARLGLDKGLVCVDWRELMDELGHDVLLV